MIPFTPISTISIDLANLYRVECALLEAVKQLRQFEDRNGPRWGEEVDRLQELTNRVVEFRDGVILGSRPPTAVDVTSLVPALGTGLAR